MVHGAIFGSEKVIFYLKFDKGCINAVDYIQILKKQQIPELVKQNGLIYQCDNAPVHTAKITKAEFATWLYANGKKATILNWPPHSPDLNPIEMVWAIMKQNMKHYKK